LKKPRPPFTLECNLPLDHALPASLLLRSMTRREFLALLSRAGLMVPALSPACAPALRTTPSGTGLSLGYVVGDVSESSAVIWLRAEPGSQVVLHYGADPAFRDYVSLPAVSVGPDVDHTARFCLTELAPGRPCFYRAVVLGKKAGPVARFVTAPAPEDERKVVFCFSGDTRDNYQPFSVMEAVRAQNPDFFLHLGDTIYADHNGTAKTLPQFWGKYRANRSDAATQALNAHTSEYAVWDDHEVANNYLPSHPLAATGQRAFLDYWPLRPELKQAGQIYRSSRWGRALELFLLDGRQYRDPEHGSMLGARQKQWLLEGLAASSAIFKFVATPVTMAGGGRDRWDGYPDERKEIFQFIRKKRIHGVVFLSTDLHYAAIARIPKSGGLMEVSAGPLGAPLNRITDGSARRFQFFLAENFNFARISVDPKIEPMHAEIEFIDADQRTFHRARIFA
jgi:alkaline phosphatase D